MNLDQLQPGDIVYAAHDILNDGTIPFVSDDALIAEKGTRGVLINSGYLEENENQTVYLVRFENSNRELKDPIGCWPEDLATHLTN